MTAVPSHTEQGPAGTPPKKSPIFAVFFFVIIVLVVIGAFLVVQRRGQYQTLAKETENLPVSRRLP